MKYLFVTRTVVAAAVAALCIGSAHAQTLYTETFEAAPLSNAGYYPSSTVTNTGLQVLAGPVAIADGGPGQGHVLNLFSGSYASNYDPATNVGYSTVSSLATFDLLAGYTYTLSYDYSRGFGAGGNGPFATSLIASFGSHSASYDDVTGFYYGPNWQAGALSFTQATTELGAHVNFTATAPGGYSGMAIDNISLIGLAPTTTPGIPGPQVPAVPEPSSYALMLAGLGTAGWFARRRKS